MHAHAAIRITAALVLVLAMAAVQWPAPEAQASSHRATRTFAASWVAPGGELEVTVTVREYGAIGQLTETLPEGFVYRGTDAAGVQVDGQTVAFPLLGVDRVAYTVTAPQTPGRYTFSGTLRDQNREARAVRGHTAIRVGPPPTATPTATATATPVPTATPTPEPTATPTPTPEPTATPTPRPTSTATATPAPRPTPEPTATATPAPTPATSPSPEPTARPLPTATATAAPAVDEPGGLAAWIIALIIVAALVVLAVLIAFSRRRL